MAEGIEVGVAVAQSVGRDDGGAYGSGYFRRLVCGVVGHYDLVGETHGFERLLGLLDGSVYGFLLVEGWYQFASATSSKSSHYMESDNH